MEIKITNQVLNLTKEEADKDKLLDSLNYRRAEIFTMRAHEGDINPADISKRKYLLK
jgi:hypothetical protein